MRNNRSQKKRMRAAVERMEPRLLLTATPFSANGAPWEIVPTGPSWVEAENYDYGGEGVAYHDTTAANQGGAYRPNEGVDVEGPATSTGGTYDVGYVSPGEWDQYTIHVDAAGSYAVDLRASNANPTAAATHLTFNNGGSVVSTGNIAVPNTGGWGTYTDHTATVTLAAGTQVMTLYDDASGCNYDYVSLTPTALAGAAEQPYNPTVVDNSPVVLRTLPTYVPAFGAATVQAEDFDTGGQAAAATGVQSGGYYWLGPVQKHRHVPLHRDPLLDRAIPSI